MLVKSLLAKQERADTIAGLGRFPQRRKWQPTPVFSPGKCHGQRSLVGFRPQGRKESDTTEQITLSLSLFSIVKKLKPFTFQK